MTDATPSRGDADLVTDALRVLSSWSAPDSEQEALRASYVDLLRRRDDAVWRSCIPAHVTASAMVVDSDLRRVLLTLHSKGRFWVQLGGHCEPGDRSLAAAALREAAEESGIDGLRLLGDDPVDLDRHALPPAFGTCGEHLDVRFVVVAPEGAVPVETPESVELRWFDTDALPGEAVVGLSRLVRRSLDYAAQPG